MPRVLKGELVTAGLRAELCRVQGNRFHPEAVLYLLKHAQGWCSSPYSPRKKPKAMELSCPAKSGRRALGTCVRAVTGAESSHPLLLQAPSALTSLPALGMCWHIPPQVQVVARHQRIQLTAFNQPLKSRLIFFPVELQELKQFALLPSVGFSH